MTIGSKTIKRQEGIRRTRGRGTAFILLDTRQAAEMARDYRKRGFSVKLTECENIALLIVR